MQLPYSPLPDGGFLFSNDKWREETLNVLTQLRHPEAASVGDTGIGVGSGGLPDIAPWVGLSYWEFIDKSPSVPESMRQRLRSLDETHDWEAYDAQVEAATPPQQVRSFRRERATFYMAGMRIGFRAVQQQMRAMRVAYHVGDVLEVLAELADTLPAEGRTVGVINLTNVVAYLGPQGFWTEEAARNTAAAVGRLPLAERAVVLDSSQSQGVPVPYLASQYVEWEGLLPYLTFDDRSPRYR